VLLDPHPANTAALDESGNDNLISFDNIAAAQWAPCGLAAEIVGDVCLNPNESAYDNVVAFEKAARDPGVELPGGIGIRSVDLWYQQTQVAGCAGTYLPGFERALNLLGQSMVTIDQTDVAIAVEDLTCHQLDDGRLIGHREVPDCYLQHVVMAGLVDTGQTGTQTCGDSPPDPPIGIETNSGVRAEHLHHRHDTTEY
jgi:hypothetical protein